MYRILTSFAFAAFAFGIMAGDASAQTGASRSAAALGSDLTEPWLLQLRPGNRVALSPPTLRRVALAPALPRPRAGPPATTGSRGIDPAYLPRLIDYPTSRPEGTIVIDTPARYLYLVLSGGKAMRYGVGVGRPGFAWAGTHRVSRKAEWPAWVPPDEMRQRQPYLPLRMAGGPANPLGARALYLGSSLYRIHGSNEPWTIGHAVSSGCIRMRNEDVIDLYERVGVGTRVIVI
jgi:lipoprotein-anchoring transpeptidase ErfK/SrfK